MKNNGPSGDKSKAQYVTSWLFIIFGSFVRISYALVLLVAVLIIRRHIRKNGYSDKVDTKWFLIIAISFILAIIPFLLEDISYLRYAGYLSEEQKTEDQIKEMKTKAIYARWGSEVFSFLTQLIWIYLLQ